MTLGNASESSQLEFAKLIMVNHLYVIQGTALKPSKKYITENSFPHTFIYNEK